MIWDAGSIQSADREQKVNKKRGRRHGEAAVAGGNCGKPGVTPWAKQSGNLNNPLCIDYHRPNRECASERAATGMFERFTDRARRVVVLAQEEARILRHNYIGPEHILLGLIHEGSGVAAKALESLGISQETVRQRVEEAIGRGEQAPFGHIPFTPQAKKLLESSLRESRALGHNYIGTEHILLALIGQGESVAAQVLTGLGADLNGAREQVIRLLDEYRRQHGQQAE
jgi:hypothetical protein